MITKSPRPGQMFWKYTRNSTVQIRLSDLSQDRNRWRALVNLGMSLQVPLNASNFLTSSGTTSFSRRTLLHIVS
jgi:hypothetical protein